MTEREDRAPRGRRGKCPKCGSRSIARIVYGYPAPSPDLEKELASGRLALGGCCVTGDDPNRSCNQCGHAWRAGRRGARRRGGPEAEAVSGDQDVVTIRDPEGSAGPSGKMPRTARCIGTFEWASSPVNSREDTLFISGNLDRSLWILWVSMPDLWDIRFSGRWVQFPWASCPRRGLTAEAAAEKLVTAVYRSETEKRDLERPLIVRGGTLLDEDAMSDLVEAIWGPAERRGSARRPT